MSESRFRFGIEDSHVQDTPIDAIQYCEELALPLQEDDIPCDDRAAKR